MFRSAVRGIFLASLIAGSAAALSGCAGAVLGAGAAAGVAAFEERPLRTIATDTKIATQLRVALLEESERHFAKVGIEVFEGRVLLTGIVDSEKMRADAVRLAWKTENVKEVLNEVFVGTGSLMDTAKDSWITAQLTAKMAVDKDVLAINFAVETVGATVYLMGIAQSQSELDRVIAHAREVSYVRKVISHVRVKKAGTAS